MHVRATLISTILVLVVVGLAQATGFIWAGPGDMPEDQKILLFQQNEHVGFINNPMDETDDSTGYDVTHYNLEIKFDPTNHSVVGKVDMQFTVDAGPISAVNLNLRNNLIVDSAKVNGVIVTSAFIGTDGLRLTLGSPLPQGANATSTIYYHGFPISGSWPNPPGLNWGSHLGTHIIWSLSEDIGARLWWPCKDVPWDKATARMVWTVPSNLYATSNGDLINITTPQAGWKAYEWVENHRITTYLISIAATNYAHFRNWYVSATNDSMPLDYYVYPEDSLDAVSDFAPMGNVVTFFSSRFGEYNFLDEKYGMAAFPWSGGMEHQTLTSVGANLINGTGSYMWLYVHELAHSWWGDMLTCATWSDIWLNEGQATYCDALWIQHSQSQSAFNNRMSSFRSTYINSEPSEGRFPIAYPTNPNQMWGGTVYQKGAWINHMLRYVAGEQKFWEFWPIYRDTYCPGNVPGNATTAEFQTTWEQVTGQDLDWFFNEWVLTGTHYPEYQWGNQLVPQGGNTRVNLYIKQNQTLISQTPIFNMPIQIRINRTGLPADSVVIWNSQQTQYHSFTTTGSVTSLQFDPNAWILKSVSTTSYVAPTWTVLLEPINPPIQIPANGGSFNFNVSVTNNTSSIQNTQGWIMQRQPNGIWQGPNLGPINLSIPGNLTISRMRTQNVPSTALPGVYTYEGRVGTYPNNFVATSSFNFTKLTTGDGPQVRDWANSGEDFDLWLADPDAITPLEFSLEGAFPNPFNPTTTVRFILPEAAKVKLQVYDIHGRLVHSVTGNWLNAGTHEVTFDGTGLASGVYLYTLSAGSHLASGKMVLMK